MNSEKFNVMDMNETDIEELNKTELINLVEIEKLQKKARKSKIAIVEDNDKKVPQPQKPTRSIPPRDPKPSALSRLRDAKARFVSRRQSEPAVQQVPIQIRENQRLPKPKRPPPPPPIKEHITDVPAPVIKELIELLKGMQSRM